MHRRKTYRRTADQANETLEVVAYIDEDGGDDEIRVTQVVDGQIVTDGIGFYGRGGEQWLQDRHAGWTGDGFELVPSGQDA